jgi:periplasmic protein TonB
MSHPASQDPHESQHPQSQPSLGDPRLGTEQFLARDKNFNRSQITSICIHGALASLLLLPLFLRVAPPPHAHPPGAMEIFAPISNYVPQAPRQLDTGPGGGSGGAHDPLPVTKGMLPKFGPVQIVPPSINQNPKAVLQMEPVLLAPKSFEIPQEFAPNWGDPSAKEFNNSRGRGDCCGMGDNGGDGIGNGQPHTNGYGPGPGGEGISIPGQNGVTYPVCAYCPRPDYSDEARRAKYQGTVILNVIVLPDGRASSIEVITSPGLGLDTKAIEAVRNWRFTPAHDAAGHAVAARINVEVLFQLF